MTRLLAAVTLALAMMASPAAAAHKHSRHHHHHASRHHHHRAGDHAGHRRARVERTAAVITCDSRGCSDRGATAAAAPSFYSTSSLVSAARGSLGKTASELGVRRTLWCMAALNMWLRQAGLKPSGSDAASSALALGPHVSGPRVGAIAFMYRPGGGHAGVVTGVDENGDPIIISGNHNHLVREATYPRSIIGAYVLPKPAG